MQPPHLRKTARSSQLIVNGEPILVLGAELHNSTLSDSRFFASWLPKLKAMNVDTILGAVSWAMIEPVEGEFDFAELDSCILAARNEGLHLVLLSFGSYKNAMSVYPPPWVQRDNKRFPRVQLRQAGGVLKTVNGFCRLMRHLNEFDSAYSTVVMVQVQNEVGLMGDSRDGSVTATRLFHSPVPEGLLAHLSANDHRLRPTFHQKFGSMKGKSGSLSWSEVFGPGPLAEDLFMADAFSRYVQYVAAAGRAEYGIPLYMNVALCSEDPSWQDFGYIPPDVPLGDRPGEYPSGGPVGHNLDVYRYNAADIQFYGPDIYLQNYEIISECFRHGDLPLFVPEQRRDEYGAPRIWPAYGTQLAIGRPEDIFGFYIDDEEQPQEKPWVRSFGDYTATVERAAGQFLLGVGFGYQVLFQSTDPQSVFTGVLCVEELEGQAGFLWDQARPT
ncbi:glycoside hydrolase superfamily [Aspergillus carlsbadensis]|nr:glycoside hydrolase superfamily [Aspergillus carlsbadensis]